MTQLRKTAHAGHPEDPQVRRMLATHMHCGEEMQPVPASHGLPGGVADGKDEGRRLTYHCVCGFCFDETPHWNTPGR